MDCLWELARQASGISHRLPRKAFCSLCGPRPPPVTAVADLCEGFVRLALVSGETLAAFAALAQASSRPGGGGVLHWRRANREWQTSTRLGCYVRQRSHPDTAPVQCGTQSARLALAVFSDK